MSLFAARYRKAQMSINTLIIVIFVICIISNFIISKYEMLVNVLLYICIYLYGGKKIVYIFCDSTK